MVMYSFTPFNNDTEMETKVLPLKQSDRYYEHVIDVISCNINP